jgi:hypothetical protein
MSPRVVRVDKTDQSRDGTDGRWMLVVGVVGLTRDQRDKLIGWIETLVSFLGRGR